MNVKKRIHFLLSLTEITPKLVKKILKHISTEEINAICEILHNIINSTIKISQRLKKNITRKKPLVLKLLSKKTSIKTKYKAINNNYLFLIGVVKGVKSQLENL